MCSELNSGFIQNVCDYLEIELYHTFDNLDISKVINNKIDSNNSIFFKKWLKFYRKFNGWLINLRYRFPIPKKNVNKLIEYYGHQYDVWNIQCRNLLLEAFLSFFKGNKKITIDEADVDSIEIYFILSFYEIIYNKIKENLDKVRSNDNQKASSLIEDRLTNLLIIKPITSFEKNDHDKLINYLKNKKKRYLDEKRLKYWKNKLETIKNSKDNGGIESEVKDHIKNFMENSNANIKPLIKIIIALLTKCHIKIHRFSFRDYLFIDQYLGSKKEAIDQIIHAQRILTFTRLASHYFIKSSNHTYIDNFGICLQTLSFLRRGFTFFILDDLIHNAKASNEAKQEGNIRLSSQNSFHAFNDFTICEHRLTKLRTKAQLHNKTIFVSFYDLLIPYIYSLKGDIYRRNYSFYNAHQYYCNAQARIDSIKSIGFKPKNQEELPDPTNRESEKSNELIKYLRNSMKLQRFMLSKGKTFLELGEFRKALKWFFRALKAHFEIYEDNDEDIISIINLIDNFTSYLDKTRLDFEIVKESIYNHINEIHNKFVASFNSKKELKYDLIFCDIYNRILVIVILLFLPDFEQLNGNKNNTIKRHSLAKKIIKFLLNLQNKHNNKSYFLALAMLNKLILDFYFTNESCLQNDDILSDISNIDPFSLIHTGGLRDIIYRSLAINVFRNLVDTKENSNKEQIAKKLLHHLLVFTEDFSTRNAELYKYLNKPGKVEEHSNNYVYIYGLQRWSSINPAIVRPSAFKIKGGGIFIIYNKKGIAIDPGINFVENLYSEGFSIADVHCIIATHDHIDHIADIDTLISAYYRKTKLNKEEKKEPLKLIFNPTVSHRYSFIVNQSPNLFKKIELSDEDGWRKVYDGFEIKAFSVEHKDLGSPNYFNTLGIVMKFRENYKNKTNSNNNEVKIGLTSDTYFNRIKIQKFVEENLDVFIVNINGSTFRELHVASFSKKIFSKKIMLNEKKKIKNICSKNEELCKEIGYSFGYKNLTEIYDDSKNKEYKWETLIRNKELGQHLMLYGIIEAFEEFIKYKNKNNPKNNRMFIINEISEEMGNYRHKVSTYINKLYSKYNNIGERKLTKCFTLDIGLCARLSLIDDNNELGNIEVRCSQCLLRNDYHDDDKFRQIDEIKEVCLKWEEEGLYYFCLRHDPESEEKDPKNYAFIERLERYQPYRHIDIRIN